MMSHVAAYEQRSHSAWSGVNVIPSQLNWLSPDANLNPFGEDTRESISMWSWSIISNWYTDKHGSVYSQDLA